MTWRFNPMTAADLPAVMEIERLSFASPWSPGLFLHELKLPFSRTRVARIADTPRRIGGYVCWWVVGDEAQILNLAVHPDDRRTGLGRELVRLVLDDAHEVGAASVSLEVRHDNAAARALYAGFGFAPRGLRKHYYGRNEHATIMTVRLGPAG